MSGIDVLRIRNAAAFQLPSLRQLITKALSTNDLVEDVSAALDELDYWVLRKHAGIFVVRENGVWVAFGFAQWGESAFAPFCTILHIYNSGSRAALKALNTAIVAFCKLGGYDKAMGIDMNGKPKGFGVLCAEDYGTAVPIGTTYYLMLETENSA